jgi:hypothetical protein
LAGKYRSKPKDNASMIFLHPDEICRNCAEAELDNTATQTLVDFATRIANDSALLAAAGAAHHRLFATHSDEDDPAFTHADALFGDDASTFRALLVLDSIRLIRERQSAHDVPANISRAVMAHHPIGTLQEATRIKGRIDVGNWIWGWYGVVGSGDLHQLGRLEFFFKAWDYPWRVYCNGATRETIVMLDAGLQLTDDGYMTGTLTWETQCLETDTAITGHAVSPHGFALRTPIELPRDQWQLVLGAGDIVLDLHIPGDTPLTQDAIRDSLGRSETFFDHYYREEPFKAWVCDSWLFSPQLRHMLPAESNILRWQNEGYLIPNDSGPEDFLNFVFGSATIDTATAPRNTRLRLSVIEHLERTHEPLRSGNYLFLRKDLAHFGTQPYRVSSAAAIARLAQS